MSSLKNEDVPVFHLSTVVSVLQCMFSYECHNITVQDEKEGIKVCVCTVLMEEKSIQKVSSLAVLFPLPIFPVANEHNLRKRIQSKSFHHQLRQSERQPLVGRNMFVCCLITCPWKM